MGWIAGGGYWGALRWVDGWAVAVVPGRVFRQSRDGVFGSCLGRCIGSAWVFWETLKLGP